MPVVGAKVLVEGRYYTGIRTKVWKPIISGVTDSTGQYRYVHEKKIEANLRRIVISHEGDVLIQSIPAKPPPHFLDNHWYSSRRGWLAWLGRDPRHIKDKPVWKAHIFTERPVYRPEEPVHIKGYLRSTPKGQTSYMRGIVRRSLVVEGPGNKTWSYPLTLTERSAVFITNLMRKNCLREGIKRVIFDNVDRNNVLPLWIYRERKLSYPSL